MHGAFPRAGWKNHEGDYVNLTAERPLLHLVSGSRDGSYDLHQGFSEERLAILSQPVLKEA
jgi:hypothetical protein